jgi:hypothetical protein
LNLGTPPNGQEELKLHNQNRATARFPSAMCFLRTSQCFGWHDPNFSRVAASQGSMTVPVVQAPGVVLAVFAERCLTVIPHLLCLIFGPCRRMALPLVCNCAGRFSHANEIATPVPFTVETTVLPSLANRAAARFVTQGRDCQALGVPFFSRKAAFS